MMLCCWIARSLAVLVLLGFALPLLAQLPTPPDAPTRVTDAGPTRLPDGRPGDGYWQQRVDYALDATLEPGARRLTGAGWITYHNHSPDTLRELHWHLYQNLFRPDSRAQREAQVVGRRMTTTRGITVHRVELEGVTLLQEEDGTLMRTPLPAPLPPGTVIRLRVEWEYEVPPVPTLRTGSRGADFGITQWYPQIAVYDDRRGWNTTPYLGQGEFYLEYGNWEARLTVPARYVVAATGTLQNPEQVLTAEQVERLGQVTADRIVAIVPPGETGAARRGPEGETRTWHLSAEDVRDFAWAASPSFVWDATRTAPAPGQTEGTLIHAFYRPGELPFWREGAEMARHALEFFAARFGPYIYPQATVVSGPVYGMEYPMLAFAGSGDPFTTQLYQVIAHELAHQWYPMMIGSPEPDYPFMDEGFATYITSLAAADRYGWQNLVQPQLQERIGWLLPTLNDRLLQMQFYLEAARADRDIPILTHADLMPPDRLTVAAYSKPGTVMFMLHDLLGAETFGQVMREYHRRWLLRHPYPEDFFNTVEDVSGQDLRWFWNQWFVQTWTLDLGIDGLRQVQEPGGWAAGVMLVSRGRAIMPFLLRLTLNDGSVHDVRVPETVWLGRDRYMLRVSELPARVRHAEIDPDLMLADVDRRNNTWPGTQVTTDWRPRLLMDLFPPLDAYRIGLQPELWYTRAGGLELGVSATGSYFATDDRVEALLRVGLRNRVIDGRLAFSQPLRGWGQGISWGAEAFRLGGRAGGGLELELAPGEVRTLFGARAADTRLTFGLAGIELLDAAYLPRLDEWEDGLLAAATARFSHRTRGWYGSGRAIASTELGAPASDWQYGKATLDLRTARGIGRGTTLLARAVGGYASGEVPAQTQFYLAQASPWERFGSLLFRSEGVLELRGLGERALLAGGGAVIGAPVGARGTRLLAGNLALQRGLLEVFGNAGEAWTEGQVDLRRWIADAGVGLGVDLPADIGPVRLGTWGLRIRAPLWVRDPARPEEAELGLRWRVVFGGRWGS